MTKQEILTLYESELSPDNARQYLSLAKKYLAKHDLTKASTERYIQQLRDEGYADGTIDLRWRVIRRLYKLAGEPWPFKRWESPKIRELEVVALALPKETIRTMVHAARRGHCDPIDTLYLALSTVYGLRKAEMADLNAARFDLHSNIVYVETKKHGRERYHAIPQEILPIVREVAPHLGKTSAQNVGKAFLRIEESSGIQHTPSTGFHSIRRSLDHFLIEGGATELATRSFMRWKREKADQVRRYHHVRFAGVDGGVADMADSDRKQDGEIFKVHPFLPYWRD